MDTSSPECHREPSFISISILTKSPPQVALEFCLFLGLAGLQFKHRPGRPIISPAIESNLDLIMAKGPPQSVPRDLRGHLAPQPPGSKTIVPHIPGYMSCRM